MEDLVKLISTLGFPIMVSCYLLVRMERIITDLRDELYERPCLVRQDHRKGDK